MLPTLPDAISIGTVRALVAVMRKHVLLILPSLWFAACAGSTNGDASTEDRKGSTPQAGVGGQTIAPTSNAAGTPGGSAQIGHDGATPVPALPAEVERNVEFELPHAGEHYVYAVNPESDTVAVIDASTLSIQSVEAGDQPTFLQTLAGRDAAIVLNVRSNDATVLSTADGASIALTLPVQPGANAIAVAPDGKHAVVYFNSTFKGAGTNGSFQDISVLFLEQDKERSEAMTVGFQPSDVVFSADGARAFVVTTDGISILDFAKIEKEGPAIAQTVALGTDANASLDVSVTPDGKYALARREGQSELRLVELDSGKLHLLDLAKVFAERSAETRFVDAGLQAVVDPDPSASASASLLPSASASSSSVASSSASASVSSSVGDAGAALQGSDAGSGDVGGADAGPSTSNGAPASSQAVSAPPLLAAITDVDLAPSGQYALAVVRDQSAVIRIAVPGAFIGETDPDVIDIGNELVGSVGIAPDSNRALLYTTALDTQERISVLDLKTGAYKPVKLPKSVESVSIAQNSKTALIVHKKLAGDPNEAGISLDAALDRSYGYSVLDLDSGFSKLQTTPVQVGPSTIVPDASNLFVLLNAPSTNVREVHQVDLQSFVVQHRLLGSPPTSVGAVPGSKKVFVGQDHPDGRIAFIDWVTGDIESVTGFELNGRIRE